MFVRCSLRCSLTQSTFCGKHRSFLWPWAHLRWLSQGNELLDLLKGCSIWKGLWDGERKPPHRDGFQCPVLIFASQVPPCCAEEPTLTFRCWDCAAPSPALVWSSMGAELGICPFLTSLKPHVPAQKFSMSSLNKKENPFDNSRAEKYFFHGVVRK